jgi:hypothetical protein
VPSWTSLAATRLPGVPELLLIAFTIACMYAVS